MKLAHVFLSDKPDIKWMLCRQMGVKYAVAKLSPELTGKKPIWDFPTLEAAKASFADNGFDLIALEGDQFDMTRIKLGLPGREDDARHYRQMLRNMGRLGITTLCYNFMQTGWFRTSIDLKERGGALVTGFDAADAALLPRKEYAPVTAEKVWDNYKWFIREVLPAAEDAGVRMGLHPDDPPVPSVEGVERVFINPEAIDRALSLSDSISHALTFCQGTYVTMGADIPALFHKWRDRVAFVHIRDVVGTPEHFHETFHDNGPTDMPAMFRMYADEGFCGIIRSDHVPTMAGESNDNPSYSMNGNIFGIGYIKGIMDALNIKQD
ncbi:MAG: mannonate dehydratase [Bacteroidales bacterium]|nr:mannonate dehydratase [Bacteroidales bacterium]